LLKDALEVHVLDLKLVLSLVLHRVHYEEGNVFARMKE